MSNQEESQVLAEIRKIHAILDERYRDEFSHRQTTQLQFNSVMAKIEEYQPVLEVYKTGLSWSTGVMWLTKLFMKLIGGVGLIVGTIIAIRELFIKK